MILPKPKRVAELRGERHVPHVRPALRTLVDRRHGTYDADERSVSDCVNQTMLANEMLRGSKFYPFPDRAVRPGRKELEDLARETHTMILKKEGYPDVLLCEREATDRTWQDDEVAQRVVHGREIHMVGAMQRKDSKWFVFKGDASDEEARIVHSRLKGLGAIINFNTLTPSGAWGLLFVHLTVIVDGTRGCGRVVDAQVGRLDDLRHTIDVGSPGSFFREV